MTRLCACAHAAQWNASNTTVVQRCRCTLFRPRFIEVRWSSGETFYRLFLECCACHGLSALHQLL